MKLSHLTNLPRKRGFTLIELLVVIAIIALLIGLLLPALGKARKAGRLVVSMTNIRSIAQAGAVYQADQKGFLPIVPAFNQTTFQVTNPLRWCTWSGFGKPSSSFWMGFDIGVYDIRAENRPLNIYLYPDLVGGQCRGSYRAPIRPAPTWPCRSLKIPVTRSATARSWPFPNSAANNGAFLHTKMSARVTTGRPSGTINSGTTRDLLPHLQVSRADSTTGSRSEQEAFQDRRFLQPSRMVWLADEWADIVTNQTDANARVRNGYDDINRAAMGFMDGHAAYHEVFPGPITNSSDPNVILNNRALNNEKYTLIFPFVN